MREVLDSLTRQGQDWHRDQQHGGRYTQCDRRSCRVVRGIVKWCVAVLTRKV